MAFPSFDNYANFAATTLGANLTNVATTATLASGGLPVSAPFDAVIWPAGTQATAANAEIVRVTSYTAGSTSIGAMTRASESTTATAFSSGDNFAANITLKALTDLQAAAPLGNYVTANFSTTNTTGVTVTGTSFNIGANQVWQFQASGEGAASATTNGLRFGISAPTGVTGFITYQGCGTTTSTFVQGFTTTMNAVAAAAGAVNRTTTPWGITIDGTVSAATTGGTIQLLLAASVTTAAVTYSGLSSIVAWRVG